MRERKIGALPVVEHGRVVGLLTETDVLAALDKVLGDRIATIDPFPGGIRTDEPYDYGFDADREDRPNSNGGVVD